MKKQWLIKDWAGNTIHFKNRPILFESFDDAEEVLSEELDDYDTDRGEYEIQPVDGF